MSKLFVVLFYIACVVPRFNGNIIIESDKVTDWGGWGSWDRCPSGSFAVAFSLKVEQSIGSGDDTALNGVKLYCANLSNLRNLQQAITSKVGPWGNWGSILRCPNGFINGFQFRAEPSQRDGDDTAGNNLRVFCSGRLTGSLEGDGTSWGNWGRVMMCYEHQGICGIRTQVEDHQGRNDDTSLNNIQMECCDIPNPAETCLPRDAWETVIICDATNRLTPYTCTYEYRTGTTVSFGSNTGSETSNTFSSSVSATLSNTFSQTLGRSSTTSFNWASSTSSVWSSETSRSASFEVTPGFKAVLSQVVGHCGNFVVYTTSFKLQDFDIDGNLVSHN